MRHFCNYCTDYCSQTCSQIRASLLVLALAALSLPATAFDPEDWLDGAGNAAAKSDLVPRNSLVSQPSLSAAQAAASVRSEQGGGRVLSVSPASRGGLSGYRVRILVDGGRVKTIFVGEQRPANNPIRTIGDR
jgi:hypothetical protein